MGKVTITAPDELVNQWKDVAKKREISMSQLIRKAMGAYMLLIQKQENKKKGLK